ncbi:MAG: hypothetical protein GY726_11325 [Proteobacteria bacterium]|nr:hypothetical protein [Pseudomonadota bacterium]
MTGLRGEGLLRETEISESKAQGELCAPPVNADPQSNTALLNRRFYH